jgi:hypothetical protein
LPFYRAVGRLDQDYPKLANWAHLVVRLGRPTSCAGGEARDAPKPNERVYRQETKTAAWSARIARQNNRVKPS